jgi:hypothetical protein
MAFFRAMHGLVIVVGVLAAITYGICLDLVTTRVCIEYFTIGHIPIIASKDTNHLALAWGVVATWWVGLAGGILIGLAGIKDGKLVGGFRAFIFNLLLLFSVTAVAAILMGIVGYYCALTGICFVPPRFARNVPLDAHPYFVSCIFAHSASYVVSALGILLICWRLHRQKGTQKLQHEDSNTKFHKARNQIHPEISS